jgi:hypothetical protein
VYLAIGIRILLGQGKKFTCSYTAGMAYSARIVKILFIMISLPVEADG